MTINRNIQPNIYSTEKVNYPDIKEVTFPNGTKLYYINGGSQDIVKIDFVYKAGLYYQKKAVTASMTNAMLTEGTPTKSSVEIAEIFDFYGAYISNSFSQHYGQISVITLNKHLNTILDTVKDIIANSSFDENELKIIKKNKKESYIINSEKTSVMARRQFMQAIFGKEHSYANTICKEDFDNIYREDLINFYKERYLPEECEIIVSGKVNDTTIKTIEQFFGKENSKKQAALYNPKHIIKPSEEKIYRITKADAVQSSIRIGKQTINKLHPDYIALKFLNVLFGGYFGSRLMSNIREDKGYTYGIYSTVSSMPDCGYFAISTDVGNKVCSKALKEIHTEIDRLQNETISQKEIDTVRNYFIGEMLRAFDGPFAVSDIIRANLPYNTGKEYYLNGLEEIKNINPSRLMDIAQQYLSKDSMYEVIAGA